LSECERSLRPRATSSSSATRCSQATKLFRSDGENVRRPSCSCIGLSRRVPSEVVKRSDYARGGAFGVLDDLEVPQADHPPPSRFGSRIWGAVARDVSRDLLVPVLAGPAGLELRRMPVPKRAVDEDSQSGLAESQIRLPWQVAPVATPAADAGRE